MYFVLVFLFNGCDFQKGIDCTIRSACYAEAVGTTSPISITSATFQRQSATTINKETPLDTSPPTTAKHQEEESTKFDWSTITGLILVALIISGLVIVMLYEQITKTCKKGFIIGCIGVVVLIVLKVIQLVFLQNLSYDLPSLPSSAIITVPIERFVARINFWAVAWCIIAIISLTVHLRKYVKVESLFRSVGESQIPTKEAQTTLSEPHCGGRPEQGLPSKDESSDDSSTSTEVDPIEEILVGKIGRRDIQRIKEHLKRKTLAYEVNTFAAEPANRRELTNSTSGDERDTYKKVLYDIYTTVLSPYSYEDPVPIFNVEVLPCEDEREIMGEEAFQAAIYVGSKAEDDEQREVMKQFENNKDLTYEWLRKKMAAITGKYKRNVNRNPRPFLDDPNIKVKTIRELISYLYYASPRQKALHRYWEVDVPEEWKKQDLAQLSATVRSWKDEKFAEHNINRGIEVERCPDCKFTYRRGTSHACFVTRNPQITYNKGIPEIKATRVTATDGKVSQKSQKEVEPKQGRIIFDKLRSSIPLPSDPLPSPPIPAPKPLPLVTPVPIPPPGFPFLPPKKLTTDGTEEGEIDEEDQQMNIVEGELLANQRTTQSQYDLPPPVLSRKTEVQQTSYKSTKRKTEEYDTEWTIEDLLTKISEKYPGGIPEDVLQNLREGETQL
jgi:hypothetical protein